MSNIYIQEPPTSGKVLLITSVGDIDIELWTREAPKATRNFIQLCLEGYYNNTIFHRVVKGFIVQGGDPSGDGSGGESIYGAPFKDEFHTRLRFARRGLVAMANAGKDDNGSQFFFTMAATPELQNKHTVFGKVTGETVFNMLKLEDGIIDHDERPQYPNRIIKTEVLINPFDDIVPRVVQTKTKDKPKKEKRTGVKNFKLLSFGEEAEEDEELAVVANSKFSGKSKSTHDILDDPKLSALPAVGTTEENDDPIELTEEQLEQQRLEKLENVRKKLKTGPSSSRIKPNQDVYEEQEDEDEDLAYYLGKDKEEENKRKVAEIRKEFRSLKKDFHQNKIARNAEVKEATEEKEKKSETLQAYDETLVKYAEKQKTLPKKGTTREQFTLELLKKFKKKLDNAKEIAEEKGLAIEAPIVDEAEDNDDESWLAHKLSFDDQPPVLARDANTKDDNWYELDDPRNPINKRRRGEDKKSSTSTKSHQKSSRK